VLMIVAFRSQFNHCKSTVCRSVNVWHLCFECWLNCLFWFWDRSSYPSVLLLRILKYSRTHCCQNTLETSLRRLSFPVQSYRLLQNVEFLHWPAEYIDSDDGSMTFSTLKTLIYEGTNGIKPLGTEFVT
jgi:hypothetical protein